MMRSPTSRILSLGIPLLVTSAAAAADLPTDKPAAPVSPVASCGSLQDFFVTACPLSYYGITVYGTVDMGVGYQTSGTPLNRNIISGIEEVVQKNSNHAQWTFVPGGLSQSNVGVKIKEHAYGDISVIAQAELGFDPYTLSLANGPASIQNNTNVALAHQSSYGDSSRAGQWDNSQAFFGLSSTTYGALTWGRQNNLTLDGINIYDPMHVSYAYSLIGYSGVTAGTGDTETARANTGIKYRLTSDLGQMTLHAAALAQTGGYAQGNGAEEQYQGQIGGEFKGLSLDAILSYDKDAVSMSPYSGTFPAGVPTDFVKLTLSDNTGIMLLAKYSWNQVKVFGGFENILERNPSDGYDATAKASGAFLTGLDGIPGVVQALAYSNPRTLQVYWTGATYSITPDLDLTGAYYHYHQLNYSGASCIAKYTSVASCDGTEDVVSAVLDWRFAKKFDAYAGVMFSEVNNGLANGYLSHTSADPSVGLRFRF
jgi:predicted porin